MDTMEAIRLRRSVRSYLAKGVEEEKLQQVLDAGRLAPSAGNRQEWQFVVVQDAELRAGLKDAARGQQFVADAPVVIVACAPEHDHVMRCGHPSFLIDVAIALQNMALAARALGLGTCWVGAFDQSMVRGLLGIPASVQVVELLALGYPTEWPEERSRRSLAEIAFHDRWSALSPG
jgi:nitroreductase